jgi:autotransporter translocation and assembly factor TamB
MRRGLLLAFGWTAAALGIIVLLIGGFVYAILQTQAGHDFVLRTALAQTPRFVNGEVRVGALRSDGLLRGFTLRDISILDERGRPFLEADSVRVRYSIRDLLARDVVLVPADVWGADVVVETLHGDEMPNVARIFAPPSPGIPRSRSPTPRP